MIKWLILLLMFPLTVASQINKFLPVVGKYNYKDSLAFSKYKNSHDLDSVLIVDEAGIVKQKYFAGGTVTNFSAGDLSPLFTTSEATTTTTPALSFSLSNAGAYTLFGRGASTGAPSYLSGIDSNWVTGLHTEAYYNTKYRPIGYIPTLSEVFEHSKGPTFINLGLDAYWINNGPYQIVLGSTNGPVGGEVELFPGSASLMAFGSGGGTDYSAFVVVDDSIQFITQDGKINLGKTGSGARLRTSSDTTYAKPMAMGAGGEWYQMTYWPGSGGPDASKVDTGRSVSINGNQQSLSYNRSWIVGNIKPFNVKDAGGDTTGVSDVSAIVQAAISSGSRNIYFPKGSYKFTSTLQLKDSMVVFGDGVSTVIMLTTNIPAFKISLGSGGNYGTIKDLLIYGNKSGGATTAQDGILLDSAFGFTASNVKVLNVGGAGFNYKNNGYCCATYTTNAPKGNSVINCYVNSSYMGVYFHDKGEYNQVNGGSFNGNTYGYYNVAAGNDILMGANFSNNVTGMYFEGGGNNGHGTVTGCTVNHCQIPLYINSVGWGMYFSNNTFYCGNATDSIKIIGSTDIRIDGGYMTTGSGIMYFASNVSVTLSNVSSLLGGVNTYVVASGASPTVIMNGKTSNAITWQDVLNTKTFSIAHTDGKATMSFNGAVFMGMTVDSLNKSLPLAASTAGKMVILYDTVTKNWFRIPKDSIGTVGGGGGSGDMLAANNLSDLVNAATARTNLGLGDLATKSVTTNFDFTGLVGVRNAGGFTIGEYGKGLLFYTGDLTTDRSWTIPNKDGTVAMLDDITAQVYPGAGIPISTGSAWGTSITNNSTNWNTAFSQTRQWDGGPTGLVAATARASLALVIGTNVQAYDADLTTYAGITPSSNIQSLLGAANYAAMRAQMSLDNVTNESKATMFTNAALTSNPTAPTQAAHDSSTKIANTLYADRSAKQAALQVASDSSFDVTRPTVNGSVKIFNKISSTNLQLSDFIVTGAGSVSKNADSNVVINITGGSGSPGGTPGQVQVNDGAGGFAGTDVPSIKNIKGSYNTTATAAGTTTLTVSSNYLQYFTGTTTQTVVMPDATTLTVGMQFQIVNNSTGLVTVNKNGGTLIKALNAGSSVILTVIDIGSAAGGWTSEYTTGYTIAVQALTSSPTDAQTVYFGMLPKAPTTTAATSKVYIRNAGTINAAEIYCYSGTAGTNESWSLYIRVNNTTDYLIATLSASTSGRVFSNTALNIVLAAGDYFEIKGVQPTWATNPLTTIYGGYIKIN